MKESLFSHNLNYHSLNISHIFSSHNVILPVLILYKFRECVDFEKLLSLINPNEL